MKEGIQGIAETDMEYSTSQIDRSKVACGNQARNMDSLSKNTVKKGHTKHWYYISKDNKWAKK